MTVSHDFDRALAAFLEEGPGRAPDRPVDAALVHARTHPRRRDVFGAFRRDPMGRQARSPFGPALVFATVALLLALSAAVYVGSRPQQPVVVPPVPTPSTSAAPASVVPTAAPTAVPTAVAPETPSPTPAPSAPTSAEVIDGNGEPATIEIVDESGLLRAAQGFPADPDRAQNAEIEVIQLPADEGAGERAVILMWVDLSCPGPHTLTIDEAARRFVLETRPCEADSFPVDHQLVLTFAEPIAATEIEVELVRLPLE